MKAVQLKLPPLYPKQREAIFCQERYGIIEASTKTGKTVGCMAWLASHAWTHGKPGHNYYWIAPIYSVSKIAYSRMKRMMMRVDPEQQFWIYNESELWIEMISGGRIWFKGSDNPDSLYGDDVFAAVIDEATRCKEEAWYAIRSTLTATQGPIRIIGNVKGRKNWAYNLARKAESGEPNMHYSKLTAYDAVEGGVVKIEEIEQAKRDLPDNIFRELYMAEPSDDGGNPFGLKAIQDCYRALSKRDPVAFGVDLGKSVDFTWVIGLDEAGGVCVNERWQSDWAQTRRRIIDFVGNVPALIDSTGLGDPIVEDIIRACPLVQGFKFTSQSKQQIMEGLASAIQRQEIGFPVGQLTNELETFEYEYTRTGVRYTAPVGLHDDGVCALALAWAKLGSTTRNIVDARWLGEQPGMNLNRREIWDGDGTAEDD